MTANNVNSTNSTDNTNSATPASTSTSTESSAPVPHDDPDLDPLLSFADMLFGGKLTSILVCQKCKHISQTYEDFNDISLSIKPEDYFFGRSGHGGKRDKLRKLAKRLTTFPGSGSHAATRGLNLNANSTTTTTPGFQAALSSMEMQRSSSVPPSPSRQRAADGNAHSDGENASLVEHPRRRSLDLAETGVVGTMLRGDVDVETSSSVEADNEIEGMGRAEAELEVPVLSEEVELSRLEPPEQGASDQEKEGKVKEDEIIMESDSSHVLVHVVSPEERHVELVEPTLKAKGKDGKDKKEDVGWAKLGRRISIMTGGLGRSKEKTKSKERDRKHWSMDRSGLGSVIQEKLESSGDGSMQKSTSDSGAEQATDLVGPSGRTIMRSKTATAIDMSTMDITSASHQTIMRSRTATAVDTSAKDITTANHHVAAVPAPIAVTASSSSSGSASTTAHNFFKPLARASSSLSTSTLNANTGSSTSQLQSSQNQNQNQNQHLAAPSDTHQPPSTSSSTSLPLFPNVQRSRSPKPPKPTTAESEYLRKILADVVSSSPGLNSPFSLFKPPTLLLSGTHPFSTSASTGSSGKGGGMWLGLNQFSGIEECLRLFTAVEVLDGENMVGCRRCWKIANGVLDVKSSMRQEEEDSDQEEQEQEREREERPADGDARRHETQVVANGVKNQDEVVLANEGGSKKQRPALEALSTANINAPIHIPTSMSTPTVSFYTLPNSSDSLSTSSLPTEATSISDGFCPKESSGDDDNSYPLQCPGPGGMPIPTISTTSPLDTPTDAQTSFARAEHLAISTKESMVEPSVMDNKNRTINGILSGQSSSINSSSSSTLSSTYATPLSSVPSSLSMQVLSAYHPSGSKGSLLIPKRPRYNQRRKTCDSSTTSPSASATDNDESSDDEESDTSVGTSVSGESYASASVTQDAPSSSTHPSSMPQPKSEGQQQQQQQAQEEGQQTSGSTSNTQQPKPKEKKPKPVIMRPAYKRYLIAVPPPVLVIHLKRFQQTSKMPLISFSHGLKKLDDYVSFPEYLNLMPFLAPKKEDYGLGRKKRRKSVGSKTKEEKCMYRLYAVVVHIGNMVSFPFFRI